MRKVTVREPDPSEEFLDTPRKRRDPDAERAAREGWEQHHDANGFRADTSSGEAFRPLHFGLK